MMILTERMDAGLPGNPTATTLQLYPDLSYEEWRGAAPVLGRIVQTSMWWLGDWLLFGEQKWGEMYAQAMDETGLPYATLKTAKWVAAEFPPEARRPTLSWSHHREVAPLPPAVRDQVLDAAEPLPGLNDPQLSTRDTRREVRVLQAAPDDPAKQYVLRIAETIAALATRLRYAPDPAGVLGEIDAVATDALTRLSAA